MGVFEIQRQPQAPGQRAECWQKASRTEQNQVECMFLPWVQHLWFLCQDLLLPVNLPFLGIASDGAGRKTPLGLSFPACGPGVEQGTHLLQVSELQARLQLVTSGWEVEARRPVMLGLSHNTSALHPADHILYRSADARPTSAVTPLILIYSCNIYPQWWIFSCFFTDVNL